jgi:glutathione S-transferase
VVESRTICERLVATDAGKKLVPAPFQGPVWAYADFSDGPLEDVLFRIASPSVRDAWERPSDRALYVLIKERKFGAGCVDAWERDRSALLDKARHLLAPSIATLGLRPFLFGDAPTLADAALYGNCMMLEEADEGLLERLSPDLGAFRKRVDAATREVQR